ncbi:hypothetical protein [Victivallis sp. Marseille-Q1083]|uniref:hypothetical protein n=1 Tax=Victivallis sp. Marseille-Q1083 TaxID=2717288 RepID=UPI00158D0963|nr:hypothetical protein [Victivallis sp. Marseille-Q1083]
MEKLSYFILLCGLVTAGGCLSPAQEEENYLENFNVVTIKEDTEKERIEIKTPTDWQNWNPKTGIYRETDADFEVEGKSVSLYGKDLLKIDPAKTICISANFKNLSSQADANVYLGFRLYDQDKKEIRDWNVCVIPDSDTVLSRKCSPESTTIYVRDASRWPEQSKVHLAFFTATDYSDLPNANIKHSAGQIIQSITKLTDHNYAVEFANPVGFAGDAATPVRLHKQGGAYMYAGGSKLLKSQESISLSGCVKGQVEKDMPQNAWCPGAAYARVIVLVRSNSEDCKIQFDSIKVEEVDSK